MEINISEIVMSVRERLDSIEIESNKEFESEKKQYIRQQMNKLSKKTGKKFKSKTVNGVFIVRRVI